MHPLAIDRVKEKLAATGVRNVKPMLANAVETGLPDRSIDLAFLFGLRYVHGGLESVLTELHRLLKPGAVLAIEKSRGSEEKMIAEVEQAGFHYNGKQGRIGGFTRT